MIRLIGLMLIVTPLLAAPRPQYWPPQWGSPWYAPYSKNQLQSIKPSVAGSADEPVVDEKKNQDEPENTVVAGDLHSSDEAPIKASSKDRLKDRNLPFQQALRHMQDGNYAKAYCLWTPLAENGNAEAQFSLGWMYHNGYGLKVDNQQTIKWWQAAASQGFANAAFALGMMYSQGGRAVEANLSKAVSFYHQAADGGNLDALPMLAHLFASRNQQMLEIAKDWGTEEWKRIGSEIRVKVKKANARSGPSTDHEILRSLEEGFLLVKLTRKGNWIRAVIADEGLLLWVYAPLVESVVQKSSEAGQEKPESAKSAKPATQNQAAK